MEHNSLGAKAFIQDCVFSRRRGACSIKSIRVVDRRACNRTSKLEPDRTGRPVNQKITSPYQRTNLLCLHGPCLAFNLHRIGLCVGCSSPELSHIVRCRRSGCITNQLATRPGTRRPIRPRTTRNAQPAEVSGGRIETWARRWPTVAHGWAVLRFVATVGQVRQGCQRPQHGATWRTNLTTIPTPRSWVLTLDRFHDTPLAALAVQSTVSFTCPVFSVTPSAVTS